MTEVNQKWLAEQLETIQQALNHMRECIEPQTEHVSRSKLNGKIELALSTAIKAQQQRRMRPQFIDNNDLFGEPVWDTLLDLFISQARGETFRFNMASGHNADRKPTILRWVSVLQERELVVERTDAADDKHVSLHLTPKGYDAMLRYLESIAR